VLENFGGVALFQLIMFVIQGLIDFNDSCSFVEKSVALLRRLSNAAVLTLPPTVFICNNLV